MVTTITTTTTEAKFWEVNHSGLCIILVAACRRHCHLAALFLNPTAAAIDCYTTKWPPSNSNRETDYLTDLFCIQTDLKNGPKSAPKNNESSTGVRAIKRDRGS